MPETSPKPPRLYTIPPSAPFLTTLAKAILAGDLPLPGGAKPDPLTLPLTTIYLPTRRAGRGLREAFLAEAKGEAMLLPRIRALGDPDEDAAIIFGAADAGTSDGAIATPAIGELRRRLALMRLVVAFAEGMRRDALAERGEGPPTFTATPAQASSLAADLARLMDFVESEEIALSELKHAVPEEYAAHWQLTAEFLEILTVQWPRFLADNSLVSPVARRTLLMARETERLAEGSAYPVIAAGSTGTVPATARLLKAIAALPNGAVVLPGLDKRLDAETWNRLGDAPEHPQHGMAELLRELGATRDDVAYVKGADPGAAESARLHLVSEALRPAGTTDRWEQFLGGSALAEDDRASLAGAVTGFNLIEAPNAHDEAEAIALVLRHAVETKGKTAALVTPDRTLARRVAARLKRYTLAVDDSAGVPVAHTVPGAFLDLVAGAAQANFAPPELMALLKHPLALLGRSQGEARAAARALERGAFRDVYVGEGLDGARAALLARVGRHRACRLDDKEHEAALRLVTDLKAAFAPLTSLGAGRISASRFAQAHAEAAEALARDAAGSSSALWQGDAGEALSVLLAELMAEGEAIPLERGDYPDFYRSLVADKAVRPQLGLHPRLFIWGPLEARLQQPDIVILGSLNEGVWPRPEEAGPWLNRPMRASLKLPAPERRIGLSAHDFAQALGANEVYLTRAEKVDGVPTVPSRWLQRLLALAKAAGIGDKLAPSASWVAWARERDDMGDIDPVQPPEPRPPVDARPRELSVTRIERWIANPYEIFAKEILKLEPMDELGAEPDAALRGQIVHRALHEFSRRYSDELPHDIEAALVAIADNHFTALAGSPVVKAFWRPAFRRFARWFAATERERREGVVRMMTEARGLIGLDNDFRLTARADRIDIEESGSVAIYDYKTGKVPSQNHVNELFAPQLPLEALIAAEGGFGDLGRRTVSALRYIHVLGRGEGGDESEAGKKDPEALAREAGEKLTALIARYANPDMAYEVKRRPGAAFRRAYEYDPYEHLARIKEWLTQEAEEDFR